VEFVERNGFSWTPPIGDDADGHETAEMIEKLAAGEINESTLTRWIEERITSTKTPDEK
jgi:hypothetical protein